ncbi:MAG: flavodoxin family protein [Ignavibacteria bacterium]
MKIVCIVGSKRNGNTYRIVKAVTKVIKSKAQIDLVQLNKINYSFCDGCLTCDETGECLINDDMKDIIGRIKLADGFIFGTPTRWGLLSGELKTFFDRLNPLAKSEELSGKKAVIFAVGQSKKNTEESKSIIQSGNSVEIFCENADIEVVEKINIYGCLNKSDVQNETNAIIKCEKAALKLLRVLK